MQLENVLCIINWLQKCEKFAVKIYRYVNEKPSKSDLFFY
jgi:hypothetical protein